MLFHLVKQQRILYWTILMKYFAFMKFQHASINYMATVIRLLFCFIVRYLLCCDVKSSSLYVLIVTVLNILMHHVALHSFSQQFLFYSASYTVRETGAYEQCSFSSIALSKSISANMIKIQNKEKRAILQNYKTKIFFVKKKVTRSTHAWNKCM